MQSAYDSHIYEQFQESTTENKWEEDTTHDATEEITLNQNYPPFIPSLDQPQQKPYSPPAYPFYSQQFAAPVPAPILVPAPASTQYKRPEIEYIHSTRKCFYLYHFTHIDNLENILKHGLLSKKEIKIKSIKNISRDPLRADKLENCSSLSISHPNYKLIYTRKYKSDDNQVHDIVLQFATKKFDELDNKYYFFQSNAAKSIFPKHDLSIYEGVEAAQKLFIEMFEHENVKYTREHCGINKYFPTFPEAEIMIEGRIPQEFINRIFVNSDNDKLIVNSILEKLNLSGIEVELDQSKFNRPNHWKVFDKKR